MRCDGGDLRARHSGALAPRGLAALRAPCLVILVGGIGSVADAADLEIRVSPASVRLEGPDAGQQLVVTALLGERRVRDLTREVGYSVGDPAVVVVDAIGRVAPRRDGRTEITIRHGGKVARVPVEVRGLASPAPASFEAEILPILTKASCNSSSCHGKAEGQGGFKLSLFGFDPVADHDAIVKGVRGRRVNGAAPSRSLLLRKASAMTPHGGGLKIEKDGLFFRRIARWMTEGASLRSDAVSSPSRIEVEPAELVLQPGSSQQLRVTAIDPDGRRRCVTLEAEYRSNNPPIAAIDEGGLLRAGEVAGEAAMLVRHLGLVAVCRVTLPRRASDDEPPYVRPPERNFVDKLVWNKLERLGIRPSDLADDATFLRRAHLDVIGMLPTPQETREFLADADPDKREKLVDRLLERQEYADYWALRWSDMLRVDTDKVKPRGAVAMTRWLRRQFRENTRYDELVRRIISVRGNTLAEGPASFFHVLDDPPKLGESVSQLFLGIRIECAKCHQHPFERWGQSDYFAFAGFFTGVKRKGVPTGGQMIFSRGGADLKHPRSDKPVPTAALGEEPAEFSSSEDRRAVLARWMTARENPYFARSIANRLWAHYFGRGLVEPLDDMRTTNPATNEPLLDALADHLHEIGFDLRAFTRTLMTSRVYQLGSVANETNRDDVQNFSHALYKALPAEVLLDAISAATAVPEEFIGWPVGYRAVELWDNRMPSYFLRIFGRPARVSVCECERGNEPSVAQALHLMNAPEVTRKIEQRHGRSRRLADSDQTPAEIIDELYLATHTRFPSREERELMLTAFGGDRERDPAARQRGAEDVLWTLLNMKEFIYNH